MRGYIGRALAAGAAVSLASAASAEVPRRFELALQCAAAATITQMLYREHQAPQDLQDTNNSFLASTTKLTRESGPSVAGMTAEQVDQEIVRRADIIVDGLNELSDEDYKPAACKHVSFEAGGGMEPCVQLGKEAKSEGF